MVMKEPQHPHGTQAYTTETPVMRNFHTKREARIAAAKLLGVDPDKGETNMATHRSKAMSDAEWAAKYGDKPRPKGSRGRSKLRHGRQSTDVTTVLASFQPDDRFTARLVWDLFTQRTQDDWMDAYGSKKACIGKVKHVLSNVASGNTYGPYIVRSKKTKGMFTFKPADSLGPQDPIRPADVVSAIGIEQEAMASVALDGETQSYGSIPDGPEDQVSIYDALEMAEAEELTEMFEPPVHTLPVMGITQVGYHLDGSPLFMDAQGVVGTLGIVPLKP